MAENTWNAQTVEYLRKLIAKGDSASICALRINIAFDMDFSRNSIIGKAFRLGLRLGSHDSSALHARVVNKIRLRKPRAPRTAPSVVDDIPTDQALDEIPDAWQGRCRWPYGDPGEEDFRYCGRLSANDTRTYCQRYDAASRNPRQNRRSSKEIPA